MCGPEWNSDFVFLSQSTKENIDFNLLVENLWYKVETLDFSPFTGVKLIGCFSAVSVFKNRLLFVFIIIFNPPPFTSEEDSYGLLNFARYSVCFMEFHLLQTVGRSACTLHCARIRWILSLFLPGGGHSGLQRYLLAHYSLENM